jgi:hypothetical protein
MCRYSENPIRGFVSLYPGENHPNNRNEQKYYAEESVCEVCLGEDAKDKNKIFNGDNDSDCGRPTYGESHLDTGLASWAARVVATANSTDRANLHWAPWQRRDYELTLADGGR